MNPPLQAPDAAAAFSLATLLIRLGLIALGAVILIRVAAILEGRLERSVRREGQGEATAREKRARTLGRVVRGITRTAIVLVALLMAVRELGLDITPALAAAGGFGVAAGLGAQAVVRDWMGGFFIIYDNEYAVGDVVQVAGVSGTVEALSLRHTEIRDGEGSLHFVPNGEIKVVTNLTKSWSSPLVKIPVSLTEDPARVAAVLDGFLREFERDPAFQPLLRETPRVLGMDEVSGAHYTMTVQARTLPENRVAVARALRFGAVARLRAEGIAIQPPPLPAPAVPPPPGPAGPAPSPPA